MKLTPVNSIPFKHFVANFPPKFEGQATSLKPKKPDNYNCIILF